MKSRILDAIIAVSGLDRPERSGYLTKSGERFGNAIVGSDIGHCRNAKLLKRNPRATRTDVVRARRAGPVGSRRRLYAACSCRIQWLHAAINPESIAQISNPSFHAWPSWTGYRTIC